MYELMIEFQKEIDNNIKSIQEVPGNKIFLKTLIQLQDTSRSYWSRIHSHIKTMTDEPSDINIEKSRNVIHEATHMNLELNDYLDKLMSIAFKKYEKGNPMLMEFLVENVFYSYYLFLDALHNVGLVYILCQSFPLENSNVYCSRKIQKYFQENDEEEEA